MLAPRPRQDAPHPLSERLRIVKYEFWKKKGGHVGRKRKLLVETLDKIVADALETADSLDRSPSSVSEKQLSVKRLNTGPLSVGETTARPKVEEETKEIAEEGERSKLNLFFITH